MIGSFVAAEDDPTRLPSCRSGLLVASSFLSLIKLLLNMVFEFADINCSRLCAVGFFCSITLEVFPRGTFFWPLS